MFNYFFSINTEFIAICFRKFILESKDIFSLTVSLKNLL